MAQCTSQRNLYTIKMSSTSVFECDLCDKSSAHKSSLSRYVSSSHKDKENDPVPKNATLFWCNEITCNSG